MGAMAAEELINMPPDETTASIRVRAAGARELVIARQGNAN